MPRLSNLAAGIVAVTMLLIAAPGGAADRETRPPSTQPRQIVPEADAPGSGGTDEPLSDKLQRQRGVLRPPAGIDPEITQPPPAEGKTPVIRPPGTPGGDQNVQPK